MDMKQSLILIKLLKFDNESTKAFKILLESKYFNKYLQFIIKAKPYWISMRVEFEDSIIEDKHNLCINKFSYSNRYAARIKFLLQENNADKLNKTLRPMYYAIGKARVVRLVCVENIFAMGGYDASSFKNIPMTNYSECIQYNYWWSF